MKKYTYSLLFFAISLVPLAYNACSGPKDSVSSTVSGSRTGNPMIPGDVVPGNDGSDTHTLLACLSGVEFTNSSGVTSRYFFPSPVNVVFASSIVRLPPFEVPEGSYSRVALFTDSRCPIPVFQLISHLGTFSISNYNSMLEFSGNNVPALAGLKWVMDYRPVGIVLSDVNSDSEFQSALDNTAGTFVAVPQ